MKADYSVRNVAVYHHTTLGGPGYGSCDVRVSAVARRETHETELLIFSCLSDYGESLRLHECAYHIAEDDI